MIRYTLLRVLIFFGCLALLWLIGLRSAEMRLFLVVGAAILSMGVSYVALRPFREDYSAQIADRVQARRAKRDGPGADEEAEDAEIERTERAHRRDEGSPDDFR